MKSSVKVGRIGRTEIRLHISLILLVPLVLFQFRPRSSLEGVIDFSLVVILFACILMHELGHTLVSWFFKIDVNSITLWPLGGFATLSRQPEKPLESFLISAAGPGVNLILAALAGGFWFASNALFLERLPAWLPDSLLYQVLFTIPVALALGNAYLAGFNLIPIFPMDGGRMLRSLVEGIAGRELADRVALLISLPLVALLALWAVLHGDMMLLLVSLLLGLGVSTLDSRMLRAVNMGIFALADRGLYYRMKGDFARAEDLYSDQIERNPDMANAWINRALTRVSMEELPAARADLEQGLKLDPQHMIGRMVLGELRSLDGDHAGALELFNQVMAEKLDWSVPYTDRAAVLLEMDRYEEALESINRSVALNPRFALAYLLRSLVRWKLGDSAGSRQDSDQALKIARRESLIFSDYISDTFKNHLDWVMDYYGRAEREKDRAALAYRGRADVFRLGKRWDQALADYNLALQHDSRDAELYLGRGQVYAQTGDPARAVEDFRQAEAYSKLKHVCQKAARLRASIESRSMEYN